MANTATVTTDQGRAFTLRLVHVGDRYGRDDCLTYGDRDNDRPNDALVEFYDQTYVDKFGPRGQFVSRYYLSTLMGDRDRLAGGLNLDGGVSVWTLDGKAMGEVWTQLEQWGKEGTQ